MPDLFCSKYPPNHQKLLLTEWAERLDNNFSGHSWGFLYLLVVNNSEFGLFISTYLFILLYISRQSMELVFYKQNGGF